MVGRNFRFVALLVAAVAIPYYMSEDAQWSSINRWWQSMWSDGVARRGGSDPFPGSLSVNGVSDPTATASPLPPNYSRRRIQSRGLPSGGEVGVGMGRFSSARPGQSTRTPITGKTVMGATGASIDGAAGSVASPSGVAPSRARPRFHDWMPIDQATGLRPSVGGPPVVPYMPPTATLSPTADADPAQVGPSLCGPDAPCVSYLVNFDVTPAWVMNNWQRVSTRLADFDLEGLRVPVMTGTDVNAIVGSMTYYFDRRQTLQRISFDGYTGDPSQMIRALSEKYSLKAEPWLGAGLYTQRNKSEGLHSVLRVVHAPVVRASDARHRFSVEFELNRPDTKLGLSERFDALLAADRDSRALVDPETSESKKTEEEKEMEALVQRLEAEAGITSSTKNASGTDRQRATGGQRHDGGARRAFSDLSDDQRHSGASDAAYSTPPVPRASEPAIPSSYEQANGHSTTSSAGSEPVKPKPLNGSSPSSKSDGFLQRLLGPSPDGATSGRRLYPSELPSNGRTFVPMAP